MTLPVEPWNALRSLAITPFGDFSMRRSLLIATLLATLVVASADTADAAQYSSYRGRAVAARRFRPFARLIELERRKNEWLRSVFFGGR